MTGGDIASLAARFGFEAAGLSRQEALSALSAWSERAKGRPYARPYEGLAAELSDASSALLLALPYRLFSAYPKGVGKVSAYYAASHRAYMLCGELADEVTRLGGLARRTNLPLKPLAQAAGLGAYGRNGVIVREGEHIALQALLLAGDRPALPKGGAAPMPCSSCGACIRACPTGALARGEVDTALCLRSYMEGKEAPPALAPLLGERLLGCDECLAACPRKGRDAPPERWSRLFAWENLLCEEAFMANRGEIGEAIGSNFARTLRGAAQRWQERQGAPQPQGDAPPWPPRP